MSVDIERGRALLTAIEHAADDNAKANRRNQLRTWLENNAAALLAELASLRSDRADILNAAGHIVGQTADAASETIAGLNALVVQLRDERDAARQDPRNPFAVEEVLTRAEKAETELEAARRDAGRYRWLRDVGCETWVPLAARMVPRLDPDANAREIDANIDASIAAIAAIAALEPPKAAK